MTIYVLTEAYWRGAASRIFKNREDAIKALREDYEDALNCLNTHPEENYCNTSCGLIVTSDCDDMWYGVIDEKEV